MPCVSCLKVRGENPVSGQSTPTSRLRPSGGISPWLCPKNKTNVSIALATVLKTMIDGLLDDTARWLPPGPEQLEPGLTIAVASLSAARVIGEEIPSLAAEERPKAEYTAMKMLLSGLREAQPYIGEGHEDHIKADALRMAAALDRLAVELEAIGIGPFPEWPDQTGLRLDCIHHEIEIWWSGYGFPVETVTEWMLWTACSTLMARCRRCVVRSS